MSLGEILGQASCTVPASSTRNVDLLGGSQDNGECGRPIQQVCPHPNACLTCDDFLTDARHLEAHRDQLERTRKLIAVADASSNLRMAEMNRQVEVNLAQVITAIEHRPKEIAADDPS